MRLPQAPPQFRHGPPGSDGARPNLHPKIPSPIITSVNPQQKISLPICQEICRLSVISSACARTSSKGPAGIAPKVRNATFPERKPPFRSQPYYPRAAFLPSALDDKKTVPFHDPQCRGQDCSQPHTRAALPNRIQKPVLLLLERQNHFRDATMNRCRLRISCNITIHRNFANLLFIKKWRAAVVSRCEKSNRFESNAQDVIPARGLTEIALQPTARRFCHPQIHEEPCHQPLTQGIPQPQTQAIRQNDNASH